MVNILLPSVILNLSKKGLEVTLKVHQPLTDACEVSLEQWNGILIEPTPALRALWWSVLLLLCPWRSGFWLWCNEDGSPPSRKAKEAIEQSDDDQRKTRVTETIRESPGESNGPLENFSFSVSVSLSALFSFSCYRVTTLQWGFRGRGGWKRATPGLYS